MSQAPVPGVPIYMERVQLAVLYNIHVSTYGLYPQAKNNKTATMVWAVPGGDTKGSILL